MHSAVTTIAPDGSVDVRGANSYDFVRFCAASAVLFSHHFDLSGLSEPRVPGFREDFGEVAVEVFFCLSGFLICRSLQKDRSWRRFVAARVLRIFPNLAFVLVVTSVATLLWYRNYTNLAAHVGYVIDNLLMFAKGATFEIPGVFSDRLQQDVNNPLWTLPYELWLYVLLGLTFVLGTRGSAAGVLVVALLLTGAWSANEAIDAPDIGPFEAFELFRLGSYFLSGAVLALAWPWIGRHPVALGAAGLVACVAARNLLPIEMPLNSLALAAAVVGLGSSSVMAWFSRGGDASYGMYVFAWPVQQLVLLVVAPFWISLVIAWLATAAIGYATWHAFEKRLMTYPRRFAQRTYKAGPAGVA